MKTIDSPELMLGNVRLLVYKYLLVLRVVNRAQSEIKEFLISRRFSEI